MTVVYKDTHQGSHVNRGDIDGSQSWAPPSLPFALWAPG
jgi:hypothetical protein